MPTCQTCGAEFDKDEGVCPECGGEAPPGANPPSEPEPPKLDLTEEELAKVRELEASIKEKPKGVALYLMLEKLYDKGGRRDLAVKLLKRCLVKIAPDNITIKARLDVLTHLQSADKEELPPSFEPVPVSPEKTARTTRWIKLALLLPVVVLLGWLLKLWLFPQTSLVTKVPGVVTFVRISPDGRTLLASRRKGLKETLFWMDLDDRKMHDLGRTSFLGGRNAVFAPDGTEVAYTGTADDDYSSAIYLARLDGSPPRRILKGEAPSLSRDGYSLACIAQGEDYRNHPVVVNTVTGTQSTYPEVEAQRTAFTADGDYLVVETPPTGKFEAMESGGRQKSKPLDEVAEGALSAGANNAAEASHGLQHELQQDRYQQGNQTYEGLVASQDIYLIDLAGRSVKKLTADHTSAFLGFLSDGRILYLHRASLSEGELFTMSLFGGDAEKLVRTPVSPVDSRLVFPTSDDRRLVLAADVREANPGMALAVTGSFPIDAFVLDLKTGKMRRLLNNHFKTTFSMMPDGSAIFYPVYDEETDETGIFRFRL